MDNLPDGWTDWDQIWYTSVDSSANGHTLKTISPSIPQGAGAFWAFRWSKCHQKCEECHDLQRKNKNKLYKHEMHKLINYHGRSRVIQLVSIYASELPMPLCSCDLLGLWPLL